MRFSYVLTGLMLIFALPRTLDAQQWKLKRYEALFGVGFCNYFGDIGGSAEEANWFGLKDLTIVHTRPAVYGGARYKIQQNVAVKLNLMYGFIHGKDEGSKNEERGFEFYSPLFESSVQGEWSIISEEQRRRSAALFNKRGMLNNYSQINLYLYAGIGGIFYKPVGNSTLEDHERFVGDPGPAIVFPAGIGMKYVISQHWSVEASLGVRLTTTDLLDGYTSDFSQHNDLYYFGFINGIYRINTSRSGWPILFGRRRRSYL